MLRRASLGVIPFEVDATINRIYLVAPRILDMLSPMKVFIGFAINVGAKLFWPRERHPGGVAQRWDWYMNVSV